MDAMAVRFGYFELGEEDKEAMECNLGGSCTKKNECLTCAAAWSERDIYKPVRENIKVLEELLPTRLEGKVKLEQGATNWKEVAQTLACYLAGDKDTRKTLSKVGG